jgi:hypothetical protein
MFLMGLQPNIIYHRWCQSIYIRTVKTLATLYLWYICFFPGWSGLGRNRVMVHITLPKWPINQFKPDQQTRKQALRAYCPNIYILCADVTNICRSSCQIWKILDISCSVLNIMLSQTILILTDMMELTIFWHE